MLPVMLDISKGPVLLVGSGKAALRRLTLLEEAGATDIRVYAPKDALAALITAAGRRLMGDAPDGQAMADVMVVFIADAPDAKALAATARGLGVLVNVEDVKALCDFYTPSVVRRGDLTIAISTNGVSPGLARRMRCKIDDLFGPEWAERLAQIGQSRKRWKDEGCDMKSVMQRTDEMIERNGWL